VTVTFPSVNTYFIVGDRSPNICDVDDSAFGVFSEMCEVARCSNFSRRFWTIWFLRRPGRRCPQDLLLVLLGLQTVRFDRSQWRLCLLIRNSLHITRTFYLLILWPYLRPLLVYLLTIPRLPVFIINSLYSNPVAAVGSHVCYDIDVKYWFRQQTTISLNVSKILTIC
jgi:hypothetical protein